MLKSAIAITKSTMDVVKTKRSALTEALSARNSLDNSETRSASSSITSSPVMCPRMQMPSCPNMSPQLSTPSLVPEMWLPRSLSSVQKEQTKDRMDKIFNSLPAEDRIRRMLRKGSGDLDNNNKSPSKRSSSRKSSANFSSFDDNQGDENPRSLQVFQFELFDLDASPSADRRSEIFNSPRSVPLSLPEISGVSRPTVGSPRKNSRATFNSPIFKAIEGLSGADGIR